MTSSEIFEKRDFLWDKECKLKSITNISKLGDVVSKLVYKSKVSQIGPGGGATSRRKLWESVGKALIRWAIFCKCSKKNGHFIAIWITLRTFLEPLERTKFLRFESQLNKSLFLLQIKFKIRLKSCILGLNFVTCWGPI